MVKLKMIVNIGWKASCVRSLTVRKGYSAGIPPAGRCSAGTPEVGLLTRSLARPIEDSVDYIKGHHATANHGAGRNCSPKHITLGKVPNGQQAGHDGDQDAGARRPEGDLGDDTWIKEASLHNDRIAIEA